MLESELPGDAESSSVSQLVLHVLKQISLQATGTSVCAIHNSSKVERQLSRRKRESMELNSMKKMYATEKHELVNELLQFE